MIETSDTGDQSPGDQESGDQASLAGQFLVAMPTMSDPRFQKTVIYMCAHTPNGAMGLVVNRLLDSITFSELLSQLGIDSRDPIIPRPVHFGGPVESGRGFVLHSADFMQEASLTVDDDVALTATVDILREIAAGGGPRNSLLALGYAGWDAGQLDQELQSNAWLVVPADNALLFDSGFEDKWERTLGKLGIDSAMLSGEAGHA